MTRRANLGEFGGVRRSLFPDGEKSRAGVEAREQLQHARGVNGIRAIIDREPDFAAWRFEMRYDRSPPWAVREQRRVEREEMRNEEHAERHPRMPPDCYRKEDRGGDNERKNQPAPHAIRSMHSAARFNPTSASQKMPNERIHPVSSRTSSAASNVTSAMMMKL